MDDEPQRANLMANIDALTLAISVRSLPLMVGSLLSTQLTIQQLKVLTAIVISDGRNTSELASAFDVSLATMSKLIERLVDQNLAKRVTDTDDHRVRRLNPTPLGRDVIAKIMAARPEMGTDILDGLSLDELDSLAIGLRAISRELHSTTAAMSSAPGSAHPSQHSSESPAQRRKPLPSIHGSSAPPPPLQAARRREL